MRSASRSTSSGRAGRTAVLFVETESAEGILIARAEA
jgi:hypothetical protein